MEYSTFFLFLGSIGPTELIVLLLIVLLIFGGSRLPSLAKGLGESVRNFKKGISDESEDQAPTTKDQTTKSA